MRVIGRDACGRRHDAPIWAGSDDHPVGWVDDRLVPLIPADAVTLMAFAAEHLKNLTPARRLAVHATALNPVTRPRVKRFRGRLFTSFGTIKPLRPEVALGGNAKAAAEIYRCSKARY